jgi:hypothetical protein
LSKQTERTIDLVRHGRTRTKAKFQLSRKLESRRSYEGGSGSRRTRERDIYAPPESQLTMPSNIAKAIYHHIVCLSDRGDDDACQESDRLVEKTKRRYLDERIPPPRPKRGKSQTIRQEGPKQWRRVGSTPYSFDDENATHWGEAESGRSSEMSLSPARPADAPHCAPERGRKQPQQRDVVVASAAGGCAAPRTRTRPKAAAAARCRCR